MAEELDSYFINFTAQKGKSSILNFYRNFSHAENS